MNFTQLKDNYCNFYKFCEAVNGEIRNTQFESFFKTNASVDQAIVDDITEQVKQSKFFAGYKVALNTSAMPDSLCSRIDNGETNFFPELALMFLKTYGAQLFYERDNFSINPKSLISIFNKNQELVEIPYPVVLLLGGLYYFQENPIVITDQSYQDVFSKINKVNFSGNIDVYNNSLLIRKPTSYVKNPDEYFIVADPQGKGITVKGFKETIYFPNVKIANRSIIGDENEYEFSVKTGISTSGADTIEKVKISSKSIMPSVGYGIQNEFLNDYNKTVFGEYLNGLTTKYDDGKPHVLAGGYTGILKPFKTYNSDVIEFTAFYRNLTIRNINYDINSLVNDLKSATQNLKKSNTNETTLLNGYIKSFIVYSKLKAAFLNGQFGTKALLKEAITSLCDINNIESAYNDSLGSGKKLCDFYFLVSHVFFTSFRELIKKDKIGSENTPPHAYDLKYRLKFGSDGANSYQSAVLTDTNLMSLLNDKNSSKSEQIESLTNFLYKIWDIEKVNLKKDKKYENINPASLATFALYPSAGGFITPNSLILPYSEENGDYLKIYDAPGVTQTRTPVGNKAAESYYTQLLHTANGKVTFNREIGFLGNDSRYNFSGVLTDYKQDGASNYAETLNQELKSAAKDNSQAFRLDPTIDKYVVSSLFDRNYFLTTTSFNNHSILKNTTRFLWFESTIVGTNLNMDRDNNALNLDFNDGITLSFKPSDLNNSYFRNISSQLLDYSTAENYTTTKYINNYDFSRLLDSVNIEKLEEFSEMFKEFAKIEPNNSLNTYNLNSLIKASTILSNEAIKEALTDGKFKDPATSIELTSDEITYMLIGNSMYNYEFIAKSNISKFFNVALTTTQKKRCDVVADEFCSYIATIANKSAIDSVTKLGDFQLSIHNFYSSPEVLFTNAKTFDELKTVLKDDSITDVKFENLIVRRILFGDQYVQPYAKLTAAQKDEIKELNKHYLYSKIHNLITNSLDLTASKNYENFYLDAVDMFFYYLNIRYTENNYKQLLRLLRSCVNYISLKIGILSQALTPDNGIITLENFNQFVIEPALRGAATEEIKQRIKNSRVDAAPRDATYVKPPVNPYYSQENEFQIEEEEIVYFSDYTSNDINMHCATFFEYFARETFETTVTNLNAFLNRINVVMDEKTNPTSGTALTEKAEIENMEDEIKKRTYYNIKSMYEKISTESNQSTPIFLPTKIEEIKSLEISDLVERLKLFYNYSIDPGYCDDNTTNDDTNYDLYEIFKVVDRGNNDIGVNVLADLTYFYKNLYTDFDETPNKGQDDQYASMQNLTNRSFHNLFDGLASQNGFLFQQIPNYVNLNGAISATKSDDESIYDIVDQLFGIHTDTDLLGTTNRETQRFGGLKGFPGYIFQLGTIGSRINTKDQTTQSIKNDNLNSFCLDVGYDNNREISVNDEEAPDDIKKSNVTCFTVDFGTQRQQMFTSVQLDTAEFYDTEESIRTWVDVVNNTQTSLQTTNLFPILEKQSYTCTVTSLGNATIQPLSYFYLRNVPLFYGTYWITNVSHDIQPNTMITTFKGARQPVASKLDVRRQLIELMRRNAKLLREESVLANVLVTEGVPSTSGEVYADDSVGGYGDVLQAVTSDSTKYYRFPGIQLIGTFIHSITKSNSKSDANVGLVHTLYNLSAGLLGNTTDHAKIVANMKSAAVGIMKDKASNGDGRYGSGNLNLGNVFKQNSTYSTTGELADLLNDISNNGVQIITDSKLNSGLPVYNFKTNSEIKNNSDKVSFVMDTDTGYSSANIGIQQSTFFFDNNDTGVSANTELYGIGVKDETTTTYPDLYDLFVSLGANNEIKDVESAKKIKSNVDETHSSGKPRPEQTQKKTDDIVEWLDFFKECSPTAAKFGLFISNGKQTKADYEKYFIDHNRNIKDDSDDAWEKVPKDGFNVKEAVYYGLVDGRNISVTDPGYGSTIDIEYQLDGLKSYDCAEPKDRTKFFADFEAYIGKKQAEWDKENTTTTSTTESGIQVKFMGSIPGSSDSYKVAFFSSDSGGGFGKIKLSSNVKSSYNLQAATATQLENIYEPKTGNAGSSDAVRFRNEIINVANGERQKWTNLTECQDEAKPLLTNYWSATKYTGWDCNTAWSAAFISYIIKQAAPVPNDFPYSSNHSHYIVDVRDGNTSFKALTTKETPLQLGDILCYGADSNYSPIEVQLKDFKKDMYSHCDCVVNIASKRAEVIGGNNSNKVGANYAVNLDDNNYVTDSKKTVILRFEPPNTNTSISTTAGSSITVGNIITNGTYLGNIVISDYQNDWLAVTCNYIAKNESFVAKAAWDENAYRAGYGTSKVYRNGSLQDITQNSVVTEQEAKDTLVYEIKNSYATSVEKGLGADWNKLNKYQRASLVSLAYNAGPAWATAKSGYGKQIKDGIAKNDFQAAANGIKNGPTTGAGSGQVLPGLVRRRNEEAELFLLDPSLNVTYVDSKGKVLNAANQSNSSSNNASSGGSGTSNTVSVVIGDSLFPSIRHANPKIGTLENLALGGKHLKLDVSEANGGKSLITLLKTAKVYDNVKHLVVTIGANDLWGKYSSQTADQNEAINLIKQKFPKAKYYIMNGNWGWPPYLSLDTDTEWQNRISTYISVFKNAGFEVIGQATKVTSHPGINDAFYNTYKDKLKTLP